MSGQSGIYYYDRRPVSALVTAQLTGELDRLGPDGGGEHMGEGLLMAFREFRVEPDSQAHSQPHQSALGNVITWDGRLDNRFDLIPLLGDRLKGNTTDPALAMAAYEKWGTDGFHRLIGDWSAVVWDAEGSAVILASDYMGVRPLFYNATETYIAWSSCLGILARWVGSGSTFDNHYIARYLTFCPTYERTIYPGILYVPSGASIAASKGKTRLRSGWAPSTETRIRYRCDADYEEHFIHLFRESVASRMRTGHPLCCDLSGGLDSTAVTCMARHLLDSGTVSPERVFTLSIFDPAMDDVDFIPLVESKCKLDGIHIGCAPTWSLDLPAGPMPSDNAPLATLQSAAMQEHAVRAHLTGRGGDLVMGNTLNDADQLADAIQRCDVPAVLNEAYAWSRVTRMPIWHTLRLGVIPLLSPNTQYRLWKEKSRTETAPYGALKQEGLVQRTFLKTHLNEDVYRNVFEYRHAPPSQRHFLQSLSLYQATHVLARSWHRYPIAETHPYCDRRVVEFIAAIPRAQLCRPGRPRDLMRRACADLLPSAVRERRTKALSAALLDKTISVLAPAFLTKGTPLYTVDMGFANGPLLESTLTRMQNVQVRREELVRVLSLEVWLRARNDRDATRSDPLGVPLFGNAF